VGVVSMHDFYPHSNAKRGPAYTSGGCTSATLPTYPGTCYNLVPADFQTIYNITPLLKSGLNGSGQVIAVVEDSDTYDCTSPCSTIGADVTDYRAAFLSAYGGPTPYTVHPGQGCTDPGISSNDFEADLDAEVAGVAAPKAQIVVAACSDTTTAGALIAIQNYSSYTTKPNIFSVSYGECEATNGAAANAALSSAYSSVNASGVSVFVATGDGGPTQCAGNGSIFPGGTGHVTGGTETATATGIGVNAWGSTIYNAAMGGTDFEDTYNASRGVAPNNVALTTYWNAYNVGTTGGSAKSYIPEIPWNQSCASWLVEDYVAKSTLASTNTLNFCNTSTYYDNTVYQANWIGAGGPSGCATGAATTSEVVSGTCAGYPKPSWQSGIYGNPADGVRDIPDVSLFASDDPWGHAGSIYYEGALTDVGGTSQAAPLMAGIQAVINQKWGNQGNPVSTYYAIAKSEYSVSGYGSTNTGCYSISQLSNSRRGIYPNCPFYDITQGDNNANCYKNGPGCWYSSSTFGVISTEPISAVSVVAGVTSGGSGYTSAPTCAPSAPLTLSAYISYGVNSGNIYPGGTAAGACMATVTSSSTSEVGTLTVAATPSTTSGSSWVGATFVVGSTTYTFVSGTPTAVNQVELNTSSETSTAQNIEAVITATSGSCGTTGCVPSGQTANPAVTSTKPTNGTVTLTAKTAGAAGNFALAVYNNGASDLVPAYTTIGAGPNYVSAVAAPSSKGNGYAGGTGCVFTGGGGSGATCQVLVSTAAAGPSGYAPAFYATPGWDFTTGIGSVNAYNLVFNSAW